MYIMSLYATVVYLSLIFCQLRLLALVPLNWGTCRLLHSTSFPGLFPWNEAGHHCSTMRGKRKLKTDSTRCFVVKYDCTLLKTIRYPFFDENVEYIHVYTLPITLYPPLSPFWCNKEKTLPGQPRCHGNEVASRA